ncbi:hypothetical protein BLA29_014967 [Euroglyphus maynei]|uniref:Uncharacterized protein n=1 Tax=Euroglyphus maynei TaxID=6958 RepID=A0A1Y3BGY3_EURMA|nr:hypothetical protein BLA29_014967 [Euroglyphus maynei]
MKTLTTKLKIANKNKTKCHMILNEENFYSCSDDDDVDPIEIDSLIQNLTSFQVDILNKKYFNIQIIFHVTRIIPEKILVVMKRQRNCQAE